MVTINEDNEYLLDVELSIRRSRKMNCKSGDMMNERKGHRDCLVIQEGVAAYKPFLVRD